MSQIDDRMPSSLVLAFQFSLEIIYLIEKQLVGILYWLVRGRSSPWAYG